jgi:hypothetical protein
MVADQLVVAQPFELVQFQAGGGVDVVRGQRLAPGVVEQHDAGPVLLLVLGLHRAQELDVLVGLVVVLGAHDGVAVVAQFPELGDVVQHQHVVVDEDRPALVVRQDKA